MPGTDYETVLEKYKAQGKLHRQHHHLGDHRRDAGRRRLPHQRPRLPGPGRHGRLPAAKKSDGGKGSIAEQLVDNRIDVLMGGGMSRYDQATDAGPTVLSYAQAEPRTTGSSRTPPSMNAITSLAAARCSASSPRAT